MIISADKNGQVDPPVLDFIKYLDVEIPVIPLTRLPNYKFNENLYGLYEWVLIDYIEYGANEWKQDVTHIWGKNTELFKNRFTADWEEWIKFDEFCKKNPPKLTFKRELLQKDVSDVLKPCDYPCKYSVYETGTDLEFNARPIELFHYWGHSNESRRIFQGEAWLHAVKENVTICDNIYYLNSFLNENYSRLWATINIPHFARIALEEILFFNNKSKLSLSFAGDGVKCFRHAEAPINSVMVMEENKLAWAYEWIHGYNCIKFSDNPIEAIETALKRTDLYQIYKNGLETLDKYRINNYLNNYIKPLIEDIC